jgi:hypothetical protein
MVLIIRQVKLGQSGARFCNEVAAWVLNIFCKFYFSRNHKITNSSTTMEARLKNNHRFGILRIKEIFDMNFIKF